jgi:hypothetical protein
MSTPTIEGLRGKFIQKKLHDLVNELDEGTTTLEDFMNMTKVDWKEVAGVLAGIQIYNYLNPRREGTEF